MNAQLNHLLAPKRTADLQNAGEPARLAREVHMWLRDGTPMLSVTATATSAAIAVQLAPPPPPTPALSALDITPPMFTLTERRVGGQCHRGDRGHRPRGRQVMLRGRTVLNTFEIRR